MTLSCCPLPYRSPHPSRLWFTILGFCYVVWIIIERMINYTYDRISESSQAMLIRRFRYVAFHGIHVEEADRVAEDEAYKAALTELHASAREVYRKQAEEEEAKKYMDWEAEKAKRGGEEEAEHFTARLAISSNAACLGLGDRECFIVKAVQFFSTLLSLFSCRL